MQVAKRDCNAPPIRDLNIWLCERHTDLSVMGVRVGVANFFLCKSIAIDETNTLQLRFFIYHESWRNRFGRFGAIDKY